MLRYEAIQPETLDLLNNSVIEDGIKLWSIQDIAAAKISAITNRGSKKDFYDLVEILNQAILALPKRCRQIFILRKLENLSHKEISQRMGISVHTVESQLTKGLKKCQKYFERKGLI